jgi:hypothetical protein
MKCDMRKFLIGERIGLRIKDALNNSRARSANGFKTGLAPEDAAARVPVPVLKF